MKFKLDGLHLEGRDVVAAFCVISFTVLRSLGINHVTDIIMMSIVAFYFGNRFAKPC